MLIFWIIPFLWASDCPHGSDRFNCVRFIKNYDGDTLTVDVPGIHPFFGQNLKVRVRGIDTPEVKGGPECQKELGRRARRLVEAELKNAKRIDLKINYQHKLDKYGRLLADVIYDQKDLSAVLLKNQLAVRYDGQKKSKVDWCHMTKRGAP